MSKTKSNVPKSKRPGYDFWGKRPGSGYLPVGKIAKRIIHKIERRQNHEKIKEEILNNNKLKPCVDCACEEPMQPCEACDNSKN